MIRGLRFTDVARQLLPGHLGGGDFACTHAELGGLAHRLTPLEFARWSLSPSKEQHPLAVVRGGRVRALAFLRTRQGPKAWEVAHLFAGQPDLHEVGPLLDRAVSFVGSRGGERLFLRIDHHGPVQEIAKEAGFFPAFTEEVFRLNRPMPGTALPPGLEMRPPLPADTHGLFRLYNASLPSSVRAASGLTLDQWRDARELGRGAVREYVWEADGRIRGWIRIDQSGRTLTVDALLHPDDGVSAPLLVEHAANLARGHARSVWLVPSYQPAIGRSLEQRGWRMDGAYTMLIRSAAVRIEERSLIRAQA
jgi:hypothetical protein